MAVIKIEITTETIEKAIDEMWGHELDTFNRDLWRSALRAALATMRKSK